MGALLIHGIALHCIAWHCIARIMSLRCIAWPEQGGARVLYRDGLSLEPQWLYWKLADCYERSCLSCCY